MGGCAWHSAEPLTAGASPAAWDGYVGVAADREEHDGKTWPWPSQVQKKKGIYKEEVKKGRTKIEGHYA